MVPWLVYVGVAVLAPAANGAWRDAAFAEHATITLLVSAAMFGGWVACTRGASSRRSSETAGLPAAPRALVNIVD
jgi:hypothetical protein